MLYCSPSCLHNRTRWHVFTTGVFIFNKGIAMETVDAYFTWRVSNWAPGRVRHTAATLLETVVATPGTYTLYLNASNPGTSPQNS